MVKISILSRSEVLYCTSAQRSEGKRREAKGREDKGKEGGHCIAVHSPKVRRAMRHVCKGLIN